MSVVVFTLGGTIAMSERDGTVTRLTGADLVAAIPSLSTVGTSVDVRDVVAVPSADLTFASVLDLVAAAERAIADGAIGVVVTQGTDTLEETAFLVDLVWPHSEPFVITGAMRNPTLAGPDGPANVLAAVRVAASGAARGHGALVVFADDVHAARWVRKTHSTSIGTFASPDVGPIGHVIEETVRILATPLDRPPAVTLTELRGAQTARVALYAQVFDDDGALLRHISDAYQGVVVAAFGVGHVPSWIAPILGDLADRMPVVLTSRAGAGSVLGGTYHAVGSETDLARRGLISGGLLHPWKARVLLTALLTAGRSRAEIADTFALYG
ncbi:MAG TPA: asparaginase [Micromonosporaceae bacterium]|jgi:L-asparaginase|nr:asparaginase [Micromonosporaceae bacterium]